MTAEAQNIDGKLGQIISALETEKNVSSMPLVEMAQHMQHESQLQAKRDEHDHPFDHGAKLLARAVADNACSVGAGVEFGGDKYEISGNAGPASVTLSSSDAEEARQAQFMAETTANHQRLMDEQAKKDAAAKASQSSATQSETASQAQAPSQTEPTTAEARQTEQHVSGNSISFQQDSSTAATPSQQISNSQASAEIQQQLNSFENELKQSHRHQQLIKAN